MKNTKIISGLLYWTEGSNSRTETRVTNCDSEIIALWVKCLRERYHVNEKKIRVRLQIWKDEDENKHANFWSTLLKIPRNQFHKIRKVKRGKKKGKFDHGICGITVYSTDLVKKIERDIKYVKTFLKTKDLN